MKTLKTTLLFIWGIFLFHGCEKNEVQLDPVLNLVVEEQTFSSGNGALLVPYGVPVTITANCEWDKTEDLSTINIYKNDKLYKNVKITTEKESFKFAWEVVKSEDDEEKWTFELVDAGGQKSRKDIILQKDTSRTLPSLTFVNGENYVTHDQLLRPGTEYQVFLKYAWDGKDRLEAMNIYRDGMVVFTSYLTGRRIATDDISFVKTEEDTETLVFEIIDSNGDKSTKTLKLIAFKIK